MSLFVVAGHFLFGVVLNALLLAGAALWTSKLFPLRARSSRFSPLQSAELLVTFGVVLSSTIVVLVTIAGSLGFASRRPAMLAIVTLSFIAGAWNRSAIVQALGSALSGLARSLRCLVEPGLEVPTTRIALGLLLIPGSILLVDRLLLPPVAWDALTYHLFFPLHWIQSGRLDTLVQPTGEPSSTFYPLTGEMLYYWGLLSTGTDIWSSFAQVPFVVLAVIAVGGIARSAGASRTSSIFSAVTWASIPIVLRQSVEPMVDVMSAAFFLCSAFLLLRFVVAGEIWRWIAGCACLGLTIGTKYVGLVWVVAVLPLLFLALSRMTDAERPRGVLIGIGIGLLLGGYSYARNLYVGGNPILPMRLELAGHTLLPGPRSAAEYFGSGLRQSVAATLLVSRRAILDLGPGVPMYLMGGLIALVVGLRLKRAILAAVAATSLLAVALFLVLVPYRESRHLLAPIGLALAASAVLVSDSKRRSVVAGSLLVCHAALALFYVGKGLSIAGIGPRHVLSLAAALIGATLVIRRGPSVPEVPVRRYSWKSWAVSVPLGLVLLATLSLLTVHYESTRFPQWKRFWANQIPWGSHEPKPELAAAAEAWSLLAEKTRDSTYTIAYAGTNIPYPLTGTFLRQRARFVPRNAQVESWHFDWFTTIPEPWAGPSPEAWIAGARRLGIGYLCVFREARSNDPRERFPIEAEWAHAHPELFRPIALGTWVQVFEVEARTESDLAPVTP